MKDEEEELGLEEEEEEEEEEEFPCREMNSSLLETMIITLEGKNNIIIYMTTDSSFSKLDSSQ